MGREPGGSLMRRLALTLAVFSLTYACAHAMDPEDLTHPERRDDKRARDSSPRRVEIAYRATN